MKNKNKLIRCVCVLSALALCAGCAEQTVKNDKTTAAKAVPESTAQVAATAEQKTKEQPARGGETTAASASSASSVAALSIPARAHTTVRQTTAVSTTSAAQSTLLKNLRAARKISGYYLLDSNEVTSLAKSIADDSRIYFVRLSDGTKTYYMAVDLTAAQALSLANRDVLLAVCRELDSRQRSKAHGDYVLMDYTHIVGELELHFLGYLLTGALGGENGPLARFYRSCEVADLNIDENRFGPMIDIIGAVYG